MPSLRIAHAQINPTVGNIKGNAALVLQYLELARQAGADLVAFPELCLSGYPPEDLVIKPRFLDDCQAALERLAPQCQGPPALIGYPLAQDGKIYNAAALVHEGRLVASYRKIELPNYGVFDEDRYFQPGGEGLVVDLLGMRLLITICEDIWIPRGLVEKIARQAGVSLAVNLSASPFHAGKLAERRQIIRGFCQRTGSWVSYTNLVGGQDELVFDGGSLVVDPQGETQACARRFDQDLMVVDITLPPAPDWNPPGGQYLRLDPPRPADRPIPPPPADQDLDLVDEVYQALVLGTGDYVRKNRFSKVVLGLSGGIDSALTAAVAAEALGADNVIGVTMPSQYTSEETRGDAGRLADNLGMEMFTVPIAGILEAYLKELAPVLGSGPQGVVEENLQARIRGNIVMALSNRFGWLVLTTGNKSETAVGYCTLYGDMAGGFAVIKDVPKTLVYQLSARVNQRAGRELIPQSVITRPPTAELRPDQKDTDSLPPYELLDPLLRDYVEQDLVLDELVQKGHDPQTVRKVVRLVDLNEYKRRQAPPGVKITPKAFGKDRRLPITNHYRPGWE